MKRTPAQSRDLVIREHYRVRHELLSKQRLSGLTRAEEDRLASVTYRIDVLEMQEHRENQWSNVT